MLARLVAQWESRKLISSPVTPEVFSITYALSEVSSRALTVEGAVPYGMLRRNTWPVSRLCGLI